MRGVTEKVDPTAEKSVPFHVIDVRSLETIDVGLMGNIHVIPSVEVVRIPVESSGNDHCPTATQRYPFHATDFPCPVIPETPVSPDDSVHVIPFVE